MEQLHTLRLHQREALTVTGVTEVASFDESAVLLHTQQGPLQIYGQDLKLKTLRPEDGHLVVTGTVKAMIYGETKKQGGFWRRVMG